jgi:Na+/H+-dicarboxylate symporter
METSALQRLKLPLILLSMLLLPLFFGEYVSIEVKAWLYSISLSMKSILLFVLPFVIFSFVFSCLMALQQGVVTFVLLLIASVFVSNMTAIMTGYTIGYTTFSFLSFTAPAPIDEALMLQPIWQLVLPKIISNEKALLFGFVLGMFFSVRRNAVAEQLATRLNQIANTFLRKIFIPVLPIFILGFVFKLEHDELLGQALRVYGPILFLVVGTQVTYMLVLYFIASGFSPRKFLTYLRNVFPATITGFSTISSAASMPVLILSTEKNLKDPIMARTIVPAIINIHTLGSALGLTILTLATMLTFNLPMPSLNVFMVFAFYYALAKYAVAAVPGGVIIVVAPLLETYLGFSSDMVGLITAVYMIFDPFGTATNVTGNGAFPILFSRLFRLLQRRQANKMSEDAVHSES